MQAEATRTTPIVLLLVLFVVILMIYREPVGLAWLSMALIIVVFAGDGLDGWVARREQALTLGVPEREAALDALRLDIRAVIGDRLVGGLGRGAA